MGEELDVEPKFGHHFRARAPAFLLLGACEDALSASPPLSELRGAWLPAELERYCARPDRGRSER